jgi:hypothetical protein
LLYKRTIRSATGILLLLVFAFSITPKVILHHVFANHKDIRVPSGEKQTQVNKSGFYCDTENQVVEMPYLENYSVVFDPVKNSLFQIFQSGTEDPFLSSSRFISGLRGPPSSI